MVDINTPASEQAQNTAISPELPHETAEQPTTEQEITKQFPLRLPISTIVDLENEVKTRKNRGEMIETAMYCRYVLKNHKKIGNYDAEIEALRAENARLTQENLHLRLPSENTAQPSEMPKTSVKKLKALEMAVKEASRTIAENVFYGHYGPEYYETLVIEYFRQILPQIAE
ncbi:hypothetical protein [Runella limosa]|uniref:hypothetical protein n=1 Tax=Runella limosa TaxID=370978 RepID=UPI0003FA90A8|nr:hypothetical protein [Runella limosa]